MLENGAYNKIEILTQEPNKIELIQRNLASKIQSINKQLYTLSWKESNSSLLNALNVEKKVMFLILTLIILVASEFLLHLIFHLKVQKIYHRVVNQSLD